MSIKHEKAIHVCDFCEKSEDNVSYIIHAITGVDICDECVALCTTILFDELKKKQ